MTSFTHYKGRYIVQLFENRETREFVIMIAICDIGYRLASCKVMPIPLRDLEEVVEDARDLIKQGYTEAEELSREEFEYLAEKMLYSSRN